MLISCRKTEQEYPSVTLIRPQPSNEIPLFSSSTDAIERIQAIEVDKIEPHVEISSEYILHRVYEYNIDNDSLAEQIISYKKRDSKDDFIGIMLVDYDSTRDSYFISWQSDTNATNLKSFNLYTDDITENQRQEIVALGVNNKGQQTLDIFGQIENLNYGLQLSPVLSIQADISLDINGTDRISIVPNDSSNSSYTVSSLNYDPESENPQDMLRSLYAWHKDENRYILLSTEKIPVSIVEQDQLAALYAGDIEDFHTFIEGLWQQEDGTKLILFSQADQSIQLATSDRQLHFRWINSVRWGIGSNLWVYIENEIISNLTQRLQLSAQDLDTLFVQFSGETNSTFWSGRYQRIEESPENLQQSRKNLYPYEISGLYIGNNTWEMFFAAPYITLRTPERELSGGYVIFQLNNQTILSINFFDDNGINIENVHYLINFEQSQVGRQFKRTISMKEAVLTSYGAQITGLVTILLEQIIQLEE